MSKTFLVFICIVLAIAFAVSYGELYHRWKDEKYRRIFSEVSAASYKRDSEHYQELYYDTLSKYNDCQNQEPEYPWSGYADR